MRTRKRQRDRATEFTGLTNIQRAYRRQSGHVVLSSFFMYGSAVPESGVIIGIERDGWLRIRMDGTGIVVSRSPNNCLNYRRAMAEYVDVRRGRLPRRQAAGILTK